MNSQAISSFHPLRLAFYVGWLVLGMVQAWSTDLFHDEAFYWFCSQKLSWGYLEQPPMVNLLIYLGNLLLPNELGTRILFVLLNTLSIYILERILKPKNFPLFIAIVLSVGVLSIGGFVAMCDNVLLFFTAAFFWLYKKYEEEDNLMLAVLLGITIAAMLYSKYYGLLIILLVASSNSALLKRRSFYIIIVISVGLLLPAIFWQYDHGFIGVRYHLLDNLSQPYVLTNSINFLIGLMLITGPVIGAILLFAAFRYSVENKFDAALKRTFLGVLGFLLLATFKFDVLPHWSSIAIVPMVLLAYKYLDSGKQITKWVFYLFPINIVLVMGVRLYFAVDFIPQSWELKTHYHQWDDWAQEMDRIGEGRPLIFLDDDIVKYNYYSSNTAYALNNISGRPIQYNLWNTEETLQGKDVVLVSKEKLSMDMDSIASSLGMTYYFKHIEDFRSYSKIRILSSESFIKAQAGKGVVLPIKLVSNYEKDAGLGDAEPSVRITYHVFLDGVLIINKKSNIVVREAIRDGDWMDLNIEVPEAPGSYEIRMSVSDDRLPPTINSNIIKLLVEDIP